MAREFCHKHGLDTDIRVLLIEQLTQKIANLEKKKQQQGEEPMPPIPETQESEDQLRKAKDELKTPEPSALPPPATMQEGRD